MLASVDLQDWVGKTQTTRTSVPVELARTIAATVRLDDTLPELNTGDVLPRLWHWCADLPTVAMSGLGTDGHPKLGDFLPPVALPRRMWAGGALTFTGDLHVGVPFRRTSTIQAVTEKEGATGKMVFVTVGHEVFEGDTQVMGETQDIVYLDMPTEFRPPQKKAPPEEADATRRIPVSTPLLFRFSAITFNAHRIHYDLAYAQEVEKYPALVVHGPLQAMYLMDLATDTKGQAPDTFKFRGIHPLFHTSDVTAMGRWTSDTEMTLCTAVAGSHQGMTAKAGWVDHV